MGSFIDRLERKFGRFAVRHLMYYVSALNIAGYVLYLINPLFYYQYLALDIGAVLHGQVWRLITFMMLPTDTSVFLLLISVYFYVFLGNTLENIWGSFKFNLYYFTGVIGTILAAAIMYFINGTPLYVGTYYLNMSIFLAFAVNVPNMQVLLAFIIPIKVKWLAYLDAFMLLYNLGEAFFAGRYDVCIAIVVALLNFVLYFFAFMRRNYSPKQFMRRQQFKKAVNQGYRGYQGSGPAYGGHGYGSQAYGSGGQNYQRTNTPKITRHRCAICGRTELDGEDLEFRFCSKCNGNYEYCQDHLFTHTHVQ